LVYKESVLGDQTVMNSASPNFDTVN